MKLFVGGYYLVEMTPIRGGMNHDILPKNILSLSDCICNLHPLEFCLSWISSSKNDKEKYAKKLGINLEKFHELQVKTDNDFNANKYGFSEVFSDLECAKEYYNQYFNNIPNLKLVAIATTEKHRNLFIESSESMNIADDFHGIYKTFKNKNKNIIDPTMKFLGHDILGFEYGSFHSYLCSSLENDFSEKLDIKFNPVGLIDELALAEKASDYANNPENHVEPALWQPWAVYEILV